MGFGTGNCKNCNKKFIKNVYNKKCCCLECTKKYHKKKYNNLTLNGKTGSYLRLRFEVLKRDNFKCQYCGRNIEDGIKLVVDHKIPKKSGGKDVFNNLVASCEDCNMGKGDILLSKKLTEGALKRKLKAFEV